MNTVTKYRVFNQQLKYHKGLLLMIDKIFQDIELNLGKIPTPITSNEILLFLLLSYMLFFAFLKTFCTY